MPIDPPLHPNQNHMAILVVDDYHAMVTTTRRMLQQIGFPNVSEAGNGLAALEALRRARYELVISDLRMEKMDGLTLLTEIRADPDLRHLPFIMLTASNELDRVAAAKNAGVTDYIVKPFSVATLKAKMTAAIARVVEAKPAADTAHP
jgi:two-component system chemotaxis response regulator CheY